MLQDVSLHSIQSKLASREHLKQISGGDRKKLMAQMQNPIAARFVWQRLSDTEQRCLYEVLSPKDRGKGVPVEQVQKKTKLPTDTFETAIRQLQDRWFLLEEGEALAPASRGTKPIAASTVRALFPYRECSESLAQTGRELFVSKDSRATKSQLLLLRDIRGESLEHLAQVCHVPLYANRLGYG